MKVQTEHLENHTARLIVELDEDRLEKAKQQAARQLSRRVNIPGFRKGKSPYNVVVRFLGEGAILEEALEKLGPDVYREALEDSELDPYGPGELEKIEADPFRLVFTLPLHPTVELGDYRALRLDYEEPEVTDDMVDSALQDLQDKRALIEPKDDTAQMGDQVTLDVYGELLPLESAEDGQGDEAQAEGNQDEGTEETEDTSDANEDEDDFGDGEVLIDEEQMVFVVGDEKVEPMPGFSAEVEGISPGEEREFQLTFPDDPDSGYDEAVLGRTVEFSIKCLGVASRHVPPLNDDFAKQTTNGEIETLLELRMDTRENLEKWVTQIAEEQYMSQALDALVEQATMAYPEAMVQDYIDRLLAEMDQSLQQRAGIALEDYLTVNQIDDQAFREQNRAQAVQRLERSLVLGEVVVQEQLDAEEADVDREVETMSARFGGGNEEIQQFMRERLNTEESRINISLDLMTARAFRRLLEIARGEDPPLGPTPPVEAELAADEASGAEEEVVTDGLGEEAVA